MVRVRVAAAARTPPRPPCLVTVCGVRFAALTTSLERFFASCTDQLRRTIGFSVPRISSQNMVTLGLSSSR
jgi:hypothetical protein